MKRAKRTIQFIAAFVPVVMIAVGVGAAFGWPWGVVAAGFLLWLEDSVLLRIPERRAGS